MAIWAVRWAALMLPLLSLPSQAAQEPKSVTVALHAKWNGTSHLLEAAEFMVRLQAPCRHHFLPRSCKLDIH